MPIDFLFPNPFEPDIKDIIRHQYVRKVKRRNQIYSAISGLVGAIALIVMLYYIPYAQDTYSFMKNCKGTVLATIYFGLIIVVFISGWISVSTGNTVNEIPQLTNHFQVMQTSFYIAVSNESLERLSEDCLYSKETKSELAFSYYNIYVDIYDELSGDTTRYFIG